MTLNLVWSSLMATESRSGGQTASATLLRKSSAIYGDLQTHRVLSNGGMTCSASNHIDRRCNPLLVNDNPVGDVLEQFEDLQQVVRAQDVTMVSRLPR
jgi:hypothetical protein